MSTPIIRALSIVFYLSYYEVHHGNRMEQETMEICGGLIQVIILIVCCIKILEYVCDS